MNCANVFCVAGKESGMIEIVEGACTLASIVGLYRGSSAPDPHSHFAFGSSAKPNDDDDERRNSVVSQTSSAKPVSKKKKTGLGRKLQAAIYAFTSDKVWLSPH